MGKILEIKKALFICVSKIEKNYKLNCTAPNIGKMTNPLLYFPCSLFAMTVSGKCNSVFNLIAKKGVKWIIKTYTEYGQMKLLT